MLARFRDRLRIQAFNSPSLFTVARMSVPKSQDSSKARLQKASYSESDLLCTVLTGTGRGAVAVVGLRGGRALEVLSQCFQPATAVKFQSGQIRYGQWIGLETKSLAPESVVVTPISDDLFEIHCHGGPAAVSRIISDLQAIGATRVRSGHPYHGRSLLLAEADEVLSHCTTSKTASITMQQRRSGMLKWVQDHIHSFRDSAEWGSKVREEASEILKRRTLGKVLTEPFRVVFCGQPNVGKSSLLNRIVGYDRSITFDLAGTTRDVLAASTVIDGWPVELLDTAGIRERAGAIEREGIDRAMQVAETADLLLLISEPKQSDQLFAMMKLLQRDDSASFHPNMRTVLNKCDEAENGNFSQFASYDYLVSALHGDGIERLMVDMVSDLNQLKLEEGDPVPLTARQNHVLAKIIDAAGEHDRKRLLNCLMDGEVG